MYRTINLPDITTNEIGDPLVVEFRRRVLAMVTEEVLVVLSLLWGVSEYLHLPGIPPLVT